MKKILYGLLLIFLITLCYGKTLNRIQQDIPNGIAKIPEQNETDSLTKRQIFSS